MAAVLPFYDVEFIPLERRLNDRPANPDAGLPPGVTMDRRANPDAGLPPGVTMDRRAKSGRRQEDQRKKSLKAV